MVTMKCTAAGAHAVIALNFDLGRSMGGWPRPKYDSGILERLAEMSKPYGTRMEIRDGLGYVEV